MKLIPKKSLGQNFLIDESVVCKIIKSANISNEDVIIEIGPGKGALTDRLAKKCKKVIAIELDERMVGLLKNKSAKNKNIEIIHGDILKANLPKLIIDQGLQFTGYKVIANLPYYITSPIIRLFLETEIPPREMILMVQKEVAQRIVAKPGEMSILAVSVQYYAKPEYLFTVPKTAFDPQPKIDSAVIKVTRDMGQATKNREDVRKLFQIVRAGFSAKRKTLANNLSNSLHIDKKEIEDKLVALGFSKNIRAQELGVEEWKKLSN